LTEFYFEKDPLVKMAGKLRTCKVLSQFVGKQVGRAILMNRGRVFLSTTAMRRSGYDSHGGEYQPLPIKADIGKREVVGFGMNGEESYIDHYGFPFPAIRFKEDSVEVGKLREKEKGDWKKMTVSEKKELYRSSFCQTLVELKAPTGEWKAILGMLLTAVSIGLWGFVWLTTFAYDDLPVTMTDDEHLKAQVQRMIDMRVGPVEGFASNYDYEKNEWKRMP
jgi:cytochrome c oxidase subunit 4